MASSLGIQTAFQLQENPRSVKSVTSRKKGTEALLTILDELRTAQRLRDHEAGLARVRKSEREKKRLTFPTVHGILGMNIVARAGHVFEPRLSAHRQDLTAVKLGRRMLDLRHLELRKRSLVSDDDTV